MQPHQYYSVSYDETSFLCFQAAPKIKTGFSDFRKLSIVAVVSSQSRQVFEIRKLIAQQKIFNDRVVNALNFLSSYSVGTPKCSHILNLKWGLFLLQQMTLHLSYWSL